MQVNRLACIRLGMPRSGIRHLFLRWMKAALNGLGLRAEEDWMVLAGKLPALRDLKDLQVQQDTIGDA